MLNSLRTISFSRKASTPGLLVCLKVIGQEFKTLKKICHDQSPPVALETFRGFGLTLGVAMSHKKVDYPWLEG
jgi:hypothetical protein